MKNVIFGALFLALIGIGFVGCKKEISPTTKKQSVESNTNKSLSYRVENGMLVFNTVDDFDRLIESLTDESYGELKSLDYHSYLESINSEDENTIEDAFLSVALNKDQAIQIGNFIYRINKANEKVFALKKDLYDTENYNDLITENVLNKNIIELSTEDDVFEILGEVTYEEKALSKNCQSSNENKNGGWFEYADFIDVNNIYGNGDKKRYKFSVWLRVRYDNWGIYRKLFTEFKHKEAWGGTFDETYVSIAYQVQYYQKNSSALNNVTHYPSFDFAINPNYQGTSNYEYFTKNKEVIHYRATKCLRAYVLKSWCWFRDRKNLTPKLYPNNGCLRIESGGLGSVYTC